LALNCILFGLFRGWIVSRAFPLFGSLRVHCVIRVCRMRHGVLFIELWGASLKLEIFFEL
jgi:hypothetical protein